MSRQEFPPKIRLAAWERARGLCECCGVKIRPGNGPHYDHRVPDAVGGGPTLDNCIDTGLRKEEQFSLLWTDIDLAAAQLTVRAEISKTGQARTIPILPRTLEALRARAQPFGFVFLTGAGQRYSPNSPTLYEALGKACRRAGFERISWHDLRRTCGCRLLQEHGLTMDEVARWLGHSSVRVTERSYAFLRVEHLHRALARNVVKIKQPK